MIRSWLNSFMTWFLLFFFLNHDPIWFWNKYICIYLYDRVDIVFMGQRAHPKSFSWIFAREEGQKIENWPTKHSYYYLISSTVNIVIICSLFLQRLFIGSIHFQSCMITYRSTYARLKFKTCEPEKACNEKSNKR